MAAPSQQLNKARKHRHFAKGMLYQGYLLLTFSSP
jgi:hypothetical protein